MEGGNGILEAAGGGRCGRLPALTAAGLAHGFTCRDMDPPAGAPDERAAAAAAALLAHLGHPGRPRAQLRQRHTALVHRVGAGMWPSPAPIGDAMVTDRRGIALSLATADCLPILVIDPSRPALAAVHAGWRGTLDGVLPAALRRLRADLGADLGAVRIGMGPSIRACCFEVGAEVAAAFRDRWPGCERWMAPGPRGRPHLDLAAINRQQAEAAGVPPAAFLDPGWCTRCRRDLFHSWRGDGPGAGRIVTLALLAG